MVRPNYLATQIVKESYTIADMAGGDDLDTFLLGVHKKRKDKEEPGMDVFLGELHVSGSNPLQYRGYSSTPPPAAPPLGGWEVRSTLCTNSAPQLMASRLPWQAEYPLRCKSCDFQLSYGSALRPLVIWWHHGRLSTHCGASHVISNCPMAVHCGHYGSGGTMAGWLFIAVQVV